LRYSKSNPLRGCSFDKAFSSWVVFKEDDLIKVVALDFQYTTRNKLLSIITQLGGFSWYTQTKRLW